MTADSEIDSNRVTSLKPAELEWRLIYAIIVAGKNQKFATRAIGKLLTENSSPLLAVKNWDQQGRLSEKLREARVGNYAKISKCLRQLARNPPDLYYCGPEDLEAYHGIGPKTARFFLLWTRDNARYASLDTHVLKWLRWLGYENVPTATPGSSTTYARWEETFLAEADRRRVPPRELDHAVWVEYSGHRERSGRTKRLTKPARP